MCSERICSGAMGSCGFVFQDERKKSRMLLRKADDVNREACRQPWLSMRSQNAFSPNTFLHLDLATGIFGTDSEGSCVHFGGDFDLKRHSHRLKDGLHSAGLILPAWGRELEAVEARAWSCWGEGWGCARGWFSPWICWNKKESQTWSVWTNPNYPRPCQDRGWKFTALIQVMGWNQDRPLVSYCSPGIVIHCTAVRENEVSFPIEQY